MNSFDEIRNHQDLLKANIYESFEKGGEGSKGGKVIGHTKSGKPIYEGETHGKALTSKKESYHWGNLAVLNHKHDWHAVLHPEHLEAINKLNPGESTNIKDEQGMRWEITHHGHGYNIKGGDGDSRKYKGHFKKEDIDFKEKEAEAKREKK